MAKKGEKAGKGTKGPPPDRSGAKPSVAAAAGEHDATGASLATTPAHHTPAPPAPATEPLRSDEASRPATAAVTTASPTASPTTSPTSPVARSAPTMPTAARTAESASAATTASPARGGTVTDEITRALLLPVHVAQRVMPARRAPVYLGAAALAVLGIVEWPIALGAGLAWEALSRWGPDRRER